MSDTLELEDDVANAFLADLEPDAVKADPKPALEATEADDEALEPTEGEPEEDQEEAEDTGEPDPDDAEVALEGDTKAKLRDLKDAYKVRAASQAAAQSAQAARAAAEQQGLLARAALEKAIDKAKARWAPYESLDFLALSRDPSVDAETFAAVRKEASEALQEYRFYTEELGGVVQKQQAQRQEASQAEARATVAALSNPETGIKGWNQQLYGEVVNYAVQTGASPESAQAVTSEWAIRALHKAYLYDKGLAEAKAKIEKVVHKPTRVLTSSSGSQAVPKSAYKSALTKLKQGGDVDDVADAFLASFGDGE